MIISAYRFGSLVLADRTFDSDLIIHGEKILSHWWRKEGHRLALEDLAGVSLEKGSRLIVGTGCYGQMRVSRSLEEYCRQNGITLEALSTREAVERFNRSSGEKNLIGAFHLTC
jgi:hypothetical protein